MHRLKLENRQDNQWSCFRYPNSPLSPPRHWTNWWSIIILWLFRVQVGCPITLLLMIWPFNFNRSSVREAPDEPLKEDAIKWWAKKTGKLGWKSGYMKYRLHMNANWHNCFLRVSGGISWERSYSSKELWCPDSPSSLMQQSQMPSQYCA